jgi:small subunit ribosomal protein S2
MSYSYDFTMRDLLDAGIHFGHRKNFWNPKMSKYIYGTRNGIHIVDLQQTVPLLKNALNALKEVAAKNGKILFVGTKRQASEVIAEQAQRCGQYFVNHRWLGGMMTNWPTVSNSIKTLQGYETQLEGDNVKISKKERLDLDRKREKLDKVLGGIRSIGGRPDMLFVIDTNQEHLAIAEARKLGIPIVGIVDTNSNPDSVDFMIPGNDDAKKAIELYCKLAADAVLAGIQEGLASSGVDIGNIDLSIGEAANSEMPDFSSAEAAPKEAKTKVITKKKAPAKKAAPAATEAKAE